jgi:hypothetical protein
LVCSLNVETPAANLSSSEEATEDFKSTTSTWGSCCDKSAVVTAPCLVSRFFVSIFIPRIRENKSQHWQSSLCQCKATYSRMSPGFLEAPFKTHCPGAIHPLSMD